MKDQELIDIAKKRVKDRKDFYAHFLVFACVMLVIIVINLMVTPGFLWFLFALLGWGFAVVMHYFSAFGFMGKNSDWEQKELQKELGKLKANSASEKMEEEGLILKERVELKEEEGWDDREIV